MRVARSNRRSSLGELGPECVSQPVTEAREKLGGRSLRLPERLD